jgi:UDPglucose--hexose-1-phosphate uridylyltransferase
MMSELRQDPITHDWVIVAPERAARPHDAEGGVAGCPFCPGNESLSPPPVDRIDGPDGRWQVRAVPNKFAALTADAPAGRSGDGWRRLGGFGRHEVIVETPDHVVAPGTLPADQLRRVLEMYARRYRALAAADPRLRQIVVFRNHGPRAGTSLRHPHSQVVATPAVAPETRRRIADEIAFLDATGACGICHVLAQERTDGQRIVLESSAFVTLAPFAPRGDFHLQIAPRRHVPTFAEAAPAELDDLARHLARVLGALHGELDDPDYNLIIETPPLDLVHRSASHWFIEILPRLTTPAGFELGARIAINSVTPERAASALRARLPPEA